jgi:hypothetical protein
MRLVPSGSDDVGETAVELYGVVIRASGEVMEVFTSPADAAALVATWNADEPDEGGALEVVELVIEYSSN